MYLIDEQPTYLEAYKQHMRLAEAFESINGIWHKWLSIFFGMLVILLGLLFLFAGVHRIIAIIDSILGVIVLLILLLPMFVVNRVSIKLSITFGATHFPHWTSQDKSMFHLYLKDHWLSFRVMGLCPTLAGVIGTAIGVIGPAAVTVYVLIYQFFSCLFPLTGTPSDTVCTLFDIVVNTTRTM